MRTGEIIPVLAVGMLLGAGTISNLLAGPSTSTADYYLSDPEKFAGKTVNLDVAFVKPVTWKSPVKGVNFFHAYTMDKRARQNGGWILIAVLEESAGKVADRFGTAIDAARTHSMRGVFQLTPNVKGTRLWYLDYEGFSGDILEAAKNDFWFDSPEQSDLKKQRS